MRDCLSFVLNGEPLQVRGLDPATTLLEFLRRDRRLTGTKEGCAEGDCGACTVTVAELPPEPDGTGIRHRALNACILLMPMLEGRSVTTALCILPSRPWWTPTPRNAGSARRASSCRSTRRT